jgi:hypothetical protein
MKPRNHKLNQRTTDGGPVLALCQGWILPPSNLGSQKNHSTLLFIYLIPLVYPNFIDPRYDMSSRGSRSKSRPRPSAIPSSNLDGSDACCRSLPLASSFSVDSFAFAISHCTINIEAGIIMEGRLKSSYLDI